MLSLLQLYRQQGWRIIFASPAEQGPHRFELAQWQIEEKKIPLNDDAFDQWLGEMQPDVVLFDRFMLEEQFGWRVEAACPHALRLLDSEDLHCLRQARQQAYAAKRSLQQADLFSEMAQREIAAILRCDLTFTISRAEMALLTEQFQVPVSQLLYCPFLLDEPLLAPGADFSERRHFISIGNFRHEPNWQSVLWLKQQIWPLIRAQLPGVELHIYGAYPPPKATALHAPKQGFLMKGWAENAHQVLQQARVCLAPLQFGAGLKGKFIDAMQTGTPSVTTAIGAEGMCAVEARADETASGYVLTAAGSALATASSDQWAGLLAEQPEDIAAAAVQLYQDEQLWLTKQQLGYQILQQNFARSVLEPAIWQQLETVRLQLDTHRAQHFYGAMLRFHHHRSTRFMGQWIEAKTKLAALRQQIANPVSKEST
ncbi:glycosyltransferase [Rheinheimera riviphila]|uniref:Glycosyltransferase n=2 Tax=Rheinheimera riviphila TaxID=1834037 RepID=A0A437R3M4_9GAMM|nr:glycosyltransferase [Rheinheimera riviphila]